MKEIQVSLTLTFNKMPEDRLNVNGVLRSLCATSPKIFFGLFDTVFSAVEKRTIGKMQENFS